MTSLLLNQMMDLIYIWYHDIYWSKVFISTISFHDLDLEVEVTILVGCSGGAKVSCISLGRPTDIGRAAVA